VDITMAGRSDLGPIEIVVPIDCVSRTNQTSISSSTGGNTGTGTGTSTGTGTGTGTPQGTTTGTRR
jgi:hypothetical protein